MNLERHGGTPSSCDERPAESSDSVDALIARIVREHHAYTRAALDRIVPLSEKVAALHGPQHPCLEQVADLVARLDRDLRPHMMTEEHVLFPYIERLAAATRAGRHPELSPFGAVQNPVRMMMLEHDHSSGLLTAIRSATLEFAAPSDASPSLLALYVALEELERDLLEHIDVESNVLFPMAIALEGTS